MLARLLQYRSSMTIDIFATLLNMKIVLGNVVTIQGKRGRKYVVTNIHPSSKGGHLCTLIPLGGTLGSREVHMDLVDWCDAPVVFFGPHASRLFTHALKMLQLQIGAENLEVYVQFWSKA